MVRSSLIDGGGNVRFLAPHDRVFSCRVSPGQILPPNRTDTRRDSERILPECNYAAGKPRG